MNRKKYIKNAILLLCCIGMYLFITHQGVPSSRAQETGALESPLPTPTPDFSAYRDVALAYVSEKYAIPLQHLLVEYELETPYPLSGRTFQYFLIANPQDPQWPTYGISVDIATHAIEEDITALEQAEREAYQAKYGKLESVLYERLQKIADDDVLSVAIWPAGKPIRTEEEILAILTSEFPEAAKAVAAGTKPIDVESPETATAIQKRYEELLNENVDVRLQPLAEWLTQEGYTFEKIEGMPSLTATLPKSAIQRLAQMDEVGLLYLIEEKGTDQLDTAVVSDRIPTVWQRGYTGTNIKVAVLEDGNIDSGLGCVNVVATRNSPQGLELHKTKVANIISCNIDPYRGVAYGASLVDAGFDSTGYPNQASQTQGIAALKWATESPQSAKIINISYVWETNSTINWTDRAFDYWIRTRYFTVAASAGNTASYVASPGKAWNVITVGGSNDQNTTNWSNDTMYNNSNYIDPTGGESGTDREKPEVVAPAVSITTANGNAAGPDGTSYAAPQVAGLAALLLQRNSQLNSWPEAVKAIIMASAVHNIDDVPDIDLTKDLKDGAGAIDAALADQAAQLRQTSTTDPCTSLCWWGVTTTSSSPAVGSSFDRYFKANRGERIRVVIAWMANADSETNNYSFDRLDTNFDLRVYTQGGTLVDSALSQKNNYELVDFVAPETTTYRINVKKQTANENTNSVGIAWVKDATYLPDVRRNSGNWTSTIYVRNDGARPRDIPMPFFNLDGSFASETSTFQLPANAVWSNAILPNNWQGSAIASGAEDLSTIVLNQRQSGNHSRGAYSGIAANQSSTKYYIPLAMYGLNTASGVAYSEVVIQNVNSASTAMTIDAIGAPGSGFGNYTQNVTLNSNGTYRYALNNTTNGWYGSVVVSETSSGSPKLAVVANMTFGGDTLHTYNAFPTEAKGTVWKIPLFASRLTNNFNTPVSVQNVSGSSIAAGGIVLSCTKDAASGGVNSFTANNGSSVANNALFAFNPVTDMTLPANWFGSCTVTTSQTSVSFVSLRFVGQSNEASHEAIASNNPSKVLLFPLIQKRLNDGSATAVTIQNLSTASAASVTFQYTASCGGCANSTVSCTIPAGGGLIHNHRLNDSGPAGCLHNLPNNWTGSLAVVSSNQPIGGMIQLTNINSPAGDTFMAHNGISR